jgi:hypothetical protein
MKAATANQQAHGISHKNNILILTALWTSNLTHVIENFKVKWEIGFLNDLEIEVFTTYVFSFHYKD